MTRTTGAPLTPLDTMRPAGQAGGLSGSLRRWRKLPHEQTPVGCNQRAFSWSWSQAAALAACRTQGKRIRSSSWSRVLRSPFLTGSRATALQSPLGAPGVVSILATSRRASFLPDPPLSRQPEAVLAMMVNRDEWLTQYHKRSNVETAFSMVTAKFDGRVRCKTPVAQMDEVSAKFLCHNICVVINSMYQLGGNRGAGLV